MSQTVLFIIGAAVFATTVYGTVMAGGIALARRTDADMAAAPPDPELSSADDD